MPDIDKILKDLSDDERREAKILMSPWLFAEAFLQDPVDPSKPLRLRPYQRDILKERHYRRILRMGRRVGKTIVLAIEAVYKAFTYMNRSVLIITAYEGQLDELFTGIEHLAFDSPKISGSIVRVTRKPHKIEFSNGSVITGNVGNNSVRGKCLAEGSYVWMEDLSWKRIEEVKLGDKVLSWNFEKERVEPKPVIAIHNNGVKDVVTLITKSGRYLRCTNEHRVFKNNGEETQVGELRTWKKNGIKSDFITAISIKTDIIPLTRQTVVALDRVYSRVNSIEPIEGGKARTYDITVADNNNYVAIYPPPEDQGPFNINGISNGGILVHNSANDLIIDECDYIPESILLEAIWPIATTTRDTTVILSSTPTGRHEFFYQVSVNKNKPEFNFREFHVPSTESPEWTPEHEALIRATTDSIRYMREYLAEFGEASDGVFKNKFIEPSLYVYSYDEIEPAESSYITMGVDWNEAAAGVRICILEHVRAPIKIKPYNNGVPERAEPVLRQNVLRVLGMYSISAEDYTNTAAVDFIVGLMHSTRIDYACFDRGHGHTNWELLRLAISRGVTSTGKNCAGLQHMLDKMEVVDFGGTTEVRDVTTNTATKVRTKNVLVRNTVRMLENGRYVIPAVYEKKNADGTISYPTVELEHNRLVGQMRDYSVLRITDKGEVYSKGNDHSLDALMLSTHAFLLNNDKFISHEASSEEGSYLTQMGFVRSSFTSAPVTPLSSIREQLSDNGSHSSPVTKTVGGMSITYHGKIPGGREPSDVDDLLGSSPNALSPRKTISNRISHKPRKTRL